MPRAESKSPGAPRCFSSWKRPRFLAGGKAVEGLGADLVKSHVTGVTLVTVYVNYLFLNDIF